MLPAGKAERAGEESRWESSSLLWLPFCACVELCMCYTAWAKCWCISLTSLSVKEQILSLSVPFLSVSQCNCQVWKLQTLHVLKETLTHPSDFLLPFFSPGGQFSFFTFSFISCFLPFKSSSDAGRKNKDVNRYKGYLISFDLLFFPFPCTENCWSNLRRT